MLISVMGYRRFDTRAETVVRFWTVAGGSVEIARFRWDPEGPMSARDAARVMCERVLEALAPRTTAAPQGDTGEDPYGTPPLPFPEA